MILLLNKLKQLYKYQINEARKPTEAKRLKTVKIYCQPLKMLTHWRNDFIYLCTQLNVFLTHINGHYVASKKIKKIKISSVKSSAYELLKFGSVYMCMCVTVTGISF